MTKSSRIYRTSLEFVVVIFLVVVLAALVCATPKEGLSLTQIEKLIQIHTPDEVVAEEVRSRGLGFTPTPRILDQMRQRGAGQATLAAVRERMPIGTIEIQGPPGSQITLDGTDRGTTDAQGRLVLPDLPVGDHRLVVNKPGYRPGEFQVTLAAREYKRFPVQLDWAGGFLTVRSDPPGASIEVAGLGQFKDGVSELQCPPGTYDITVARAGMKSETRSVVVVAGQHAAVEIHLMLDSQYLQKKVVDAKERLSHGDAQGAIQICSELSSLEPNNPEVESVLASAYWRTHDLAHFESAAEDAIRNGGSVTLNLAHEHLEMSGEAIHPATLTITAMSIAYDPGSASCKYRAFVVPPPNVATIEVTNKSASGFMIVRHLAPGTFLLHLDFRDSAKPDKKMTLYFATPESRIERENNVGFLVSGSNSSQLLGAVADLIRRDR
jgi:hypothetical protein